MAAPALEAEPEDPIVARIHAGNFRDATRLCAELHGEALGRFCTALVGHGGEGEELAQETLLAAFQGMASFRGEGTLRGWLFGIARRLCARKLETRTRRQGKLRLIEGPPPEGGPADWLERQQAAVKVREALSALKPSVREVLVLRYQADLSYREIAEACAVDKATARKRASRGLAHLREVVTKDGWP